MGSPARLRPYMNDNGPLILDGGLATELEAQGAHLQGDPLWSARLLHTNPQAIRDAHYRFLLSGADVITTATYQASVTGFISHLDLSSECARELLMSGVQLAKETAERFVSDSRPAGQRCPLVAGSVGPYGAFLLNGSEYTGAYAQDMTVEDLKVWHRPQVDCLAAAGADLIAFETIPSIKEAEALVELLREFPNSKAWLAFSCKDGKCISDGSLFTDAVQITNRSPQLVAVGLNCCSPALVEPLLDSAGSLLSPDMSWVVYPNSGEEWNSKQGWLTSEKASALIPELSRTWMKQGAALIGGCCRIGPAHIAELRQQLKGSSPASAV
ncbi:homocysteine S-methyltransferase 1 [Morone saxatilis]|uniref:homocysteine S-methyltransferase 1 n=1 Tax=Morone saxatilis TaxID=34816 RepID=UPI0015E24A8A|nr:homocysteine S-methyltransferase 1 [Morone saxatilis]XP_035509942.1 homocysteine S-methyltransferase 1 [Morone saxatilis]